MHIYMESYEKQMFILTEIKSIDLLDYGSHSSQVLDKSRTVEMGLPLSSAFSWVTSSLAFVPPFSQAGARSTQNYNYLAGNLSIVFTSRLAGLEVCQLLLAELEVLLQLVIHVLLPLQLVVAALIQSLHLLKLGLQPCILGRGGRAVVPRAPIRSFWICPPLTFPSLTSPSQGEPNSRLSNRLNTLTSRHCNRILSVD